MFSCLGGRAASNFQIVSSTHPSKTTFQNFNPPKSSDNGIFINFSTARKDEQKRSRQVGERHNQQPHSTYPKIQPESPKGCQFYRAYQILGCQRCAVHCLNSSFRIGRFSWTHYIPPKNHSHSIRYPRHRAFHFEDALQIIKVSSCCLEHGLCSAAWRWRLEWSSCTRRVALRTQHAVSVP